MRPRYLRVVYTFAAPVGNSRSLPTEVGSAIPSVPVVSPRPMEHPQGMSTTVEVGIPPMEPGNGASLATECPPEQPADRAGAGEPS